MHWPNDESSSAVLSQAFALRDEMYTRALLEKAFRDHAADPARATGDDNGVSQKKSFIISLCC